MTGKSKCGLLAALRPSYLRAGKAEKGRILDQFVLATRYYREYAIHLLKHGPPKPARRPRTGNLSLEPKVTHLLLSRSTAMIGRKLQLARRRLKHRDRTTTQPGAVLKHQIPVRTFADWNDACPGFTEIDLVAHCSDSTRGEYLNTLNMVDIATEWFESRTVTFRSQRDGFAVLDFLRHQFPFPLRGIDSDNDTVFINAHLVRYCDREGITFTRSHPYKKNDQSHVEGKNDAVIRNLIGYDRYEGSGYSGAERCL